MDLKKIQVATIFQPIVVVARKTFSKLNVLPNFLSISLYDLFYAITHGFKL
jgi:hypothetical protein